MNLNDKIEKLKKELEDLTKIWWYVVPSSWVIGKAKKSLKVLKEIEDELRSTSSTKSE